MSVLINNLSIEDQFLELNPKALVHIDNFIVLHVWRSFYVLIVVPEEVK